MSEEYEQLRKKGRKNCGSGGKMKPRKDSRVSSWSV